ncbi:hypothetical protein IAG44_14800 [Streptomyces roseirectus]|uniref:Lipoprotein n=1 Tax=Streptomyces roseirectus TaxID=2768066 RepID=A0A7H0ICR3_9ACTN|nr:hypothetical protein [Streptomyces roseirectus]QNP70579.1 hypothetical protein IAG44_14800 [Streptomyces roseirectus]
MSVRQLKGGRLVLVAGLGLVLAGCGIRATEVPTDFGAAPSRVRCSLSDSGTTAAQLSGKVPVRVFLLCGASLVAVDRAVPVPDGAVGAKRRVLVAQGLLDELGASPPAVEKEAGYTTDVRAGATVLPPLSGADPDDALRLSIAPNDLSSYALSQVVCTLSDSAASDGGDSVVLGGPGGGELRRYECTDEVKQRPGDKTPPSSNVTK